MPTRPTIAQALASALTFDPKSRELGRAHALEGGAFSPGDGVDMLAYASGFMEGQIERPRDAAATQARRSDA